MPSSINSSARSRLRRQAEQQSLGLEDELDFGSDEDLMETIGEIQLSDDEAASAVPDLPALAPVESNTSSRRRSKLSASRSARSLKKEEKRSRNSNSSVNSLASSSHLLPPLPPVPTGSTLDLPSEMFGSPDGRKRGSILGAFKVKGLRKWRDDQSSKASFVTDSQSASSQVSLSKIASNTSSRPSFSTSIAPSSISNAPHLGPLPSFDSVSVSEHKVAAQHHHVSEAVVSKQPPRRDEHRPAPVSDAPTPSSWSAGEISSAILPAFPATLASLEPITVLVAQATKRPPSSIMAGRSQSKAMRWSPCTLVFTLFKISTGEDSVDDERTVAHIHVFSQKLNSSTPNGAVRRAKSSAGFGLMDTQTTRVETERRYITRQSSASVSDDHTDADGRMVVLHVLFGAEDRSKGNEWVLEMKDSTRLHEWVRQIKKTAIMINAEELGYGRAIRSAFESSSVSADELAHRLSVHARSVAEQRDRPAPVQQLNDVARKESISPAASQPDVRSNAAEVAQSAALSRSRSAEEAAHQPTSVVQEAPAESVPTQANPDAEVSSPGLSLGSLNLGPNLSFPAPPSALPPPRSRGAGQAKVNVQASNALPTSSGSQASTPVSRPAPAFPPAMVSPNLNNSPQSNGSVVPNSPALVNGSTQPLVNGSNGSTQSTHSLVNGAHLNGSTPTINSPSQDTEELEDLPIARPPTPPRRNDEPPRTPNLSQRNIAPSIASTTHSGTSSTSRLRKLRGKPQVIDIMAEFNAIDAENTPPAEDEEPIRDDRERRIRFAEG